jgi:F-box-like
LSYPSRCCNIGNKTSMAPTFCNCCGDTFENGCDPRDELAELDALLERLTLKRYDLKRKINRFHSPIVRQLPPDVMSTIFEFCLPDFTDDQLLYMKKDLFTPLSLGAICSYWRDIAWSTPSLWSSLVVRDPSTKHDPDMVTGIAQEWLARSGHLPLSIHILSTFYNQTVSALVDIINQYSTRWSYLDLDMLDCYYQYLHATDNHAPILKSIQFHRSDTGRLNFQLTCPHLERATLSYFPLNGTNIQWDNLTSGKASRHNRSRINYHGQIGLGSFYRSRQIYIGHFRSH